MEYTVLYRMRGGEISRATVVADNLGALATHLTKEAVGHALPTAWCEGVPDPQVVGFPYDLDKRYATVREWVKEGRAIASFNDCGTIRYIPQTPRALEEERGITSGTMPVTTVKRVRRAVKHAAPTTGPDHTLFAQISARIMHSAASNPVITVNKEDDEKMVTGTPAYIPSKLPTFAGLMVCSSDTRANDHQVQARFGSAS